jgi:dynein heavy chain
VHETFRVFGDRLADDDDVAWLLSRVKDVTREAFGVRFDDLMSRLREAGSTTIDTDDMRRCVFGDYMRGPATDDDDDDDGSGDEDGCVEDDDAIVVASSRRRRAYAEITDVDALVKTLERYLDSHNAASTSPMNLAMFLYTAEHVSRITRVLGQPGGSLLLVGVGGSGRQSLTRLSAHVCGMRLERVEISKTYGVAEWREDLKKMLRASGGAGEHVVFLLSDAQIKTEAFVEDVNNLLNAGEVPCMFTPDERAALIETIRPAGNAAGFESPLELWGFFTRRCKDFTHVCFCTSPIGDAFRERLKQFPSLVNCCTIDWFRPWPVDALEAVAKKFVGDVDDLDDDVRRSLVRVCKQFHGDVAEASGRFLREEGRHNYVTPTSYLELLTSFDALLRAKRAEISNAKSRYEIGLQKIASASTQVATMQTELNALKPELIKTVGEVEILMTQIAKEKVEVVEPKTRAAKEAEAVAADGAAKAKAVKDECEGMLEKAMPILNSAIAALDTLKPADINYVKGLKNPPAAIKLVMEAVCVVLEVKPNRSKDGDNREIVDYWKPSLGLLNDKNFLETLKNYDKDNIPTKVIARIREKYTSNEDFTPEKAANASAAAEGLCKWVCAMDEYEKVSRLVKPKQEALAEAQGEYDVLMTGLRETQAELRELVDKLEGMERELEQNTKKKNQLSDDVDLCTVKLERAEKLIAGLGGENARWTEEATRLGERYARLTGDVLVCAGVISYLGAFTGTYRDEMTSRWVDACARENIPRSPSFSLAGVLGDPVKIREWHIAGLPNDSFSVDNGIIVDNARRWPLMIDPQQQANAWIKRKERGNTLQVIKLSPNDGGYVRTLENAITFGLPVLLENVGEELDPLLEPLLLKQVFKQAGVECMRLGDAVVEYSADFRFYVTSKLRNPHYLPETAVKVTLLNFTLTPEGLGDQLLGVVVAKERPDLETAKNDLVMRSAGNKRRLKEIEDKILQVLSSSRGNILEDETAIKAISDAKAVSNEIATAQTIADETEREIDAARGSYKPAGEYSAVLFFAISELANVEPMYQYSLGWFIGLFIASIAAATASEDVRTRLEHIETHFLFALYRNVCRSLFEKDKLLFAFSLCVEVLRARGEIDAEEWSFLLTGGIGGGAGEDACGTSSAKLNDDDVSEEDTSWITQKCRSELSRVSKLPAFEGVAASVSDDPKAWRAVYDDDAPHASAFPSPFQDALTTFQKLLLVRCVRPDKLVPAVRDFVRRHLGERYAHPPAFRLESCYDDSASTTPLVFVLSPGSDPMAGLLQFADERGMSDRISYISLGQGQGPKAAAMIREGKEAGSWVVLQNCHLAPSWMPALDTIVEELVSDADDASCRAHADFRLWMTAYPSKDFPVNILQNSVKMTNEPPKGVRANMLQTLRAEPIGNLDFFDGCSKPKPFKALLFGLCFFHAVVQERRKFGPLGWNIPYGFDDGDLRISARQLRAFVDENDSLPLDALRYATGECNYGGRVTDDKDRVLLNALLSKCYCEDIVEKPPGEYALTESGLYVLPCVSPSMETMTEYVRSLPALPSPEAFGMHPNADITKDNADTGVMLSSLLLMTRSGGGKGGKGEGGGGGGAGKSQNNVSAVVHEFLESLPDDFDVDAARRRWPATYEQSMNAVLTQEMTRFNRLLDVIRSSLTAIAAAIKGQAIMSSDNDAACEALRVNAVPITWRHVSYPSLKPAASYLADLRARVETFQRWSERGPPAVHWMSGFFFVHSFLTAALQNFARATRAPIDEVSFQFAPLGMDPHAYDDAAPEEGVYVRGLFLEGCDWDVERRVLREAAPKVLFANAPVFWLRPRRRRAGADADADADAAAEGENAAAANTYRCPVYRTQERRGELATTGHSTNFVMFMDVPSDAPSDHWVLRGAAMITSLAE